MSQTGTNWGDRLRAVGQFFNPINRARELGSNFSDHTFQTIGTGALTLLGGMFGGPLGAQVARIGSNYLTNRYNQSHAAGGPNGLPGITGPNTYGQSQPNIGTLLGIPNYAGGNPGSTGANQFLTGNFGSQPSAPSQPVGPNINLDFGQNPQQPAPQNPNGGLPGITSPNTYQQQGPQPSWHDSQGYDTGWRDGSGGSGHGGGWSTVQSGAQMAALGQLLANAGGTTGDTARFSMTPEFGTEIMRADGTVRQRGGDSRLIERTGSNRPTTAAEWIRRNPQGWDQMRQEMRGGAGRG